MAARKPIGSDIRIWPLPARPRRVNDAPSALATAASSVSYAKIQT
jgi:hypothetical protein